MPGHDKDESAAPSRRPASAFGIDVRGHLAQRKAVGDLLQRQKRLFVLREDFSHGAMTARIRYNNRYFDVDRAGLAQIRAGADPDDIWTAEEVDPAGLENR